MRRTLDITGLFSLARSNIGSMGVLALWATLARTVSFSCLDSASSVSTGVSGLEAIRTTSQIVCEFVEGVSFVHLNAPCLQEYAHARLTAGTLTLRRCGEVNPTVCGGCALGLRHRCRGL